MLQHASDFPFLFKSDHCILCMNTPHFVGPFIHRWTLCLVLLKLCFCVHIISWTFLVSTTAPLRHTHTHPLPTPYHGAGMGITLLLGISLEETCPPATSPPASFFPFEGPYDIRSSVPHLDHISTVKLTTLTNPFS